MTLTTFALMMSGERGYAQLSLKQVRPWLGVAIEDGKSGVRVKDVMPDTPAAEYGLKSGDEITAIDKTPVKKSEELIKTIQSYGVGNSVTVHYLRDGKSVSVAVKLKARPDELEMVKKQLVGRPAPDFDLEVISGKGPGSLKALKGKVMVLEFWATWCPACRASHPRLAELQKAHAAANDLVVLTVSDEESAVLKDYDAATKYGLTMLRDATHKMQSAWFVAAIPLIAVIGKDGNVVDATIGAGEYLESMIQVAEAELKKK